MLNVTSLKRRADDKLPFAFPTVPSLLLTLSFLLLVDA
jgi:hypothetical protein